MKRLENTKTILYALAWIMIVIIIVPLILASRYSFFWMDDFDAARSMINAAGNNIFEKAINWDVEMYLGHQGTYFGTFLWGGTSPFVWGKLGLLKIIAPANVIFFVVSLFFLFYKILKNLDVNCRNVVLCVALVIAPLLIFTSYNEIFFWHCGMMLFSIPLSIGFCGMALIIDEQSRLLSTIVACVCIFLAVGGHLMIATSLLYAVFMIVILNIMRYKKVSNKLLVFAATTVIGNAIAILAPGNFVRHSQYGEKSFDLLENLVSTLRLCLAQTVESCTNDEKPILIFFVVAIVIGICSRREVRLVKGILVGVLFAFWPVATIFPVVLAWEIRDNNINGTRFLFGFNLSLYVSMEVIAFIIGILLRKIISTKRSIAIFSISILSVALLWTFVNMPSAERILPIEMSVSLKNRQVQECYNSMRECLRKIENSDESDVVLVYPSYVYWAEGVTPNEDPTVYQNRVIANFYGKNSVIFTH